MAKKAISSASKQTTKGKENHQKRNHILIGLSLVLLSVALGLAFVSYYIFGDYDYSEIHLFTAKDRVVNNWMGKAGAIVAHFFLYNGFGVATILLLRVLFLSGIYLIVGLSLQKLQKKVLWDVFIIINTAVLFGFIPSETAPLSGIIGFEINDFLCSYIGTAGTVFVLTFNLVFLLIKRYNIAFEWQKKAIEPSVPATKETAFVEDVSSPEIATPKSTFEQNIEDLQPTINNPSVLPTNPVESTPKVAVITTEDDAFVIEKYDEEEAVFTDTEQTAARLVQDFGEFDPTLELSNFQFPTLNLLKDYAVGGITINQAELEENKNRIVQTLGNYKIGIAQIKATVGPTVTLYEIVPEAGIRISKIKSLEDDIALSLAALGIRIIAPIPGKGTIGIEVPNNNPTLVPMKSVLASSKFQQAEMELPIALGKTISNETLVVDLAKMPHLLMAGATGQGKSVGLNAVLTSLLYKKHPAEVKFVLVDPKKVELTLFNKIERHYLAKLPDTADAIITDNTKVIHTLNSLTIEMDNRYSLLNDASVRNIKDYNEKFKQRKLNPENGHRFLPYIVLIIDEFADLIMTAGKEVETPIARLAQLARAIGIHLIIATQRPSVTVITGIIKANFPARIAFRVTSKIDSRTILDASGADQLIGRGDLLYTQGNDLVRVQCAFIDTPEVERITEFIGAQKAYPDAYLLPEYVGEDGGGALDIDIGDRDSMFREAAEIIVTSQQGSASLLQRKLKLGYNRAGRLIDQLEAAGIVGPFEGSKARSVTIPDLVALDQFLENEKNRS